MGQVSKADSYNSWNASTNNHIERLIDNAAYTSAHPDDTLVFAGPPRLGDPSAEGANGFGELKAVGLLQNISINQSKPFQPMMQLGSSRSFYVGSKAQGSAQIGRLFVNTQSLMSALYSNVREKLGDDATFIDPLNKPNSDGFTSNYFINLDSEFFLIPFGLGVAFLNKARGPVGGLYMELCVIPNYSVTAQAGQALIMEGCSVLFDRIVPLPLNRTSQLLGSSDLNADDGLVPADPDNPGGLGET